MNHMTYNVLLQIARFAKKELQGIILNQCVWNHISTEPQNPFPINIYRILAVRFCPICKHIDQRSNVKDI